MLNFLKRFRNYLFILIVPILILNGCSDDDSDGPTAKICTISDLHYYDTSLGATGEAFQQYLAYDRKLLVESDALLKAAVSAIISEKPEIVIIPGDLTKDGEKVCHEKVKGYLQQLENEGIKVFVVPGNHDIKNPHAVSFTGSTITPVESIEPNEFAEIYGEFGYNEAIARDSYSLSYVAEPIEDLWILGMDSCRYEENTTEPITAGKFSSETYSWIKEQLVKADDEGKTVIGVMHHGIYPHFTVQPIMFEEYVINDYENISTEFADLGLKVVFTGHYHAQDIVKRKTVNDNFIFDIETGSLVTYPCPYRIIELENQDLTITSKHITEIDFDTGGVDFQNYALSFLNQGLEILSVYMLMTNFGFSQENAQQAAVYLVPAFVAHYSGDEMPDVVTLETFKYLKEVPDEGSQLLGTTLESIWIDPKPKDNNIKIDLNNGVVD